MAADDACTWSAAEVAQYVRTRLRHDIARIPHVAEFDTETLARQLEDNDVTGFAFVDCIDKETLRDEYGIKKMGVTTAILFAIKGLRKKSKMLATFQSTPSPSKANAPQDYALNASAQKTGAQETTNPVTNDDITSLPDTVIHHIAPDTDDQPRPEHAAGTKTRRGEHLVEDDRGYKRRKLDLTMVANEPTATPSGTVQWDTNFGVCPPERHSGMTVDRIFYGNTPMGGEVNLDVSDDPNFSIMDLPKYTNRSNLVNGHMKRFLTRPEIRKTKFRGRAATALLPYLRKAAPEGATISATLFQGQHNGEVTAIRTDADLLGYQIEEAVEVSVAAGAGNEHNYLLARWCNLPDDTVLPIYNRDAEDDITSSLADEVSEDEHDTQNAKVRLTKDEVLDIIHNEIETKTHKWKDVHQPRFEERDAWKLWIMIRGKRSNRDMLLEGAQKEVDRCEARLEKLIEQIAGDDCETAASVKQLCSALDVTVSQTAEAKWKVDVFQRRREPERQKKPRRTTGKRPKAGSKPKSAADADDMQTLIAEDVQAERVHHSIEDDLDLLYSTNSTEEKLPKTSNSHSSASPVPDTELQSSAKDEEEDEETQRLASIRKSEPPQIATVAEELQLDDVSETNSDDELPSPSKFTEQVYASQAVREKAEQERVTILISSDPPSSTPQSPPKLSQAEAKIKNDRRAELQRNPLLASQAEIHEWTFETLQLENCAAGILIKFVWESLTPQQRQILLRYITRLSPSICFSDVKMACQLFPNEPETYDGKSIEQSTGIRYTTRLYLIWFNEILMYWDCESKICAEDYSQPQQWDDNDLRQFHKVLRESLQRAEKAEEAAITISDDSDDNMETTVPSSRKRRVHRDRNAMNVREKALARHNMSQTGSNAALLSQVVSTSENTGNQVVISAPEDSDESEVIYLNQDLAERLKPHQVEGIRFMWRELTVSDDDDGQGCILAHTMGLGKTAQSISLLVTMTEILEDDAKRHLIPESFQGKRVLVLCPPSLITNWRQELMIWDRNHILGGVFSVDSTTTSKEARLGQLRSWNVLGGVLLIGYTMYSRIVTGKIVAKTKNESADSRPDAGFTLEEQKEARKILTERPTLALADEAHMLRNKDSATAKAAAQITTHRRIGLTGSPMSNNTGEIYALISWVAPGYLGSAEEFREYYAEPIEKGTYTESTAYERRRSLKKLAALNKIIGPKLNRADITVLKGSIKQKVEFVLTVPLTEVQRLAYTTFVHFVLSGTATGKEGKLVTQAKLFGWLALLTLLCNHPWTFRQKLKQDQESAGKKRRQSQQPTTSSAPDAPAAAHEADDVAPGDEHVSALEIHAEMVQQLLEGLPESLEVESSYKAQLVEKIIKLSIGAGDKVLLFSHSIPSLNYLGRLLRANGHRYARIDGGVDQKSRTQILQNMDKGDYDVLLISTRAGGLGLNIQSANRVIIFDFGFNPTWEEQAIGRAYRLGQLKPVFVYRFVAGGTFETLLYNKAIFKTSLASRVVDKKNPERHATNKPGDWLYAPRAVNQEDILTEIGKDPNVLDKLVAEHATSDSYIRAIKTMETLHQDANDEPLTEEEQREVDEEIRKSFMRPKGNRVAGPPSSTAPALMAPLGSAPA